MRTIPTITPSQSQELLDRVNYLINECTPAQCKLMYQFNDPKFIARAVTLYNALENVNKDGWAYTKEQYL